MGMDIVTKERRKVVNAICCRWERKGGVTTRSGSRRKFHTYLKVCVCQRAVPIRSKEVGGKVDDKSCVRVPSKAVVCGCGRVALAEDYAGSEPVNRVSTSRSPLDLNFPWFVMVQ